MKMKPNMKSKMSSKTNSKINSKKINSKSQIETMGLLVIVILVSLILFFVLMFSLKPKIGSTDKSEFIKTQAVSNFGPTMLETTIDCEGRVRTIRELLTDCGFAHEITCNGMDSCDAASKNISQILNLTLNKWGYEYNLTIETSQNIILYIATGCNSSKSSSLERTPFGTTHGSMAMIIKTC
jgi:hypothetical protein